MRLPHLTNRITSLSVVALCLFQCEPSHEPINKFSDAVRARIADLQDRRLGDSLYSYFNHYNATYRADAVQAFGSIQDSSAIGKIGVLLLNDESNAVRKAAAFALGQIGKASAEMILSQALEKEKDRPVIREILNAYGKTTRKWQLDPSPFLGDSVTAAGIAWSIYRAGLRSKTDDAANQTAIVLLSPGYSNDTRLAAAHYFSRGAKNFDTTENVLIASARNDISVEVRMAAVLALGKIHSDSSLAVLSSILSTGTDARVVVNAVRAMGSFPYARVKSYLHGALTHENVNVGIAASEVILDNADAEDWIGLANLSTRTSYWRILANLYQASLKAENTKVLADEVKRLYHAAADPYEKAAWLTALSEDPDAWQFVDGELRTSDLAQVRSAAAGALVAMNRSEHFRDGMRLPFAKMFEALMASQRDPAVVGIIAMALADTSLRYKDVLRDPAFLYAAKRRLRLPEHNESLQSIEAAIAYFEGRQGEVAVKNEFNHPIDWNLIKRIPEDQIATIMTSRGSIIIRLLVNEAPGSVANFVELAQKNYFDNKFFHRVVPNFVVQAGCKRVDGWGSENYSIRSEFAPRLYRTGSVGMASAGQDTEGTQWFITLSPTPHLDGRYTIFAEVIGGQAAVNYLQVGDKILHVRVGGFTEE
jgi:cyclophilin family peptidyl-prolyl cis-trans isomerase/HEAT repeat protein